MKKLFVLVALIGILLSACVGGRTIYGSGDMETRSYDELGDFDAISLSGFGTVYVKQGDITSIEVETDDNVFRYLEIDVRGNTLELGFDSDWNLNFNDVSIIYTITTPNLDSIDVSGAGQFFVEDLTVDGDFRLNVSGAVEVNIDDLIADDLRVTLSGVGDVTIDDGEVQSQRVTISGLGSYNAAGLKSEDADVDISGAGDARVWAEDDLDITISGAGSVRYRGDADVSQHVSGLGSVHED